MVSIKDVAKHAGVSTMTVSRVVNTPDLVKKTTVNKVTKSIKELGYIPNHSAQKIRATAVSKKRNKTIVLLSAGVATTPYSVEIISAIEDITTSYDAHLVIINTTLEPSDKDIDRLLSHRPDGVIYATMGYRQVAIPERIKSMNLVLANCYCSDGDIPCYVPDDFKGQYDGAKALFESGKRKPLYIYLSPIMTASVLRDNGLKKALKEFDIDEESIYRDGVEDCGELSYRKTINIIEDTIKSGYRFDSIVCGNDRVALVAYMYLLKNGYKIPEDVAVLGFDNMPGVADFFYPSLTTIEIPHKQMGIEAVKHIFENRNLIGQMNLPCKLIKRESI